MATIWRVQNQYGDGPYNVPAGRPRPSFNGGSPWSQPLPYEDFEVLTPGDSDNFWEHGRVVRALIEPYRFGFPTLSAVMAWFSLEDWRELVRCGFKLTRIEAREVIVSESGKQCLWR